MSFVLLGSGPMPSRRSWSCGEQGPPNTQTFGTMKLPGARIGTVMLTADPPGRKSHSVPGVESSAA